MTSAIPVHKDSDMADNSETVLKMARFVAIAHIVVGILLICSGVADAIATSLYSSSFYFWTGSKYFGIWIGAWMCVTGSMGIAGSRKERTGSRNCFARVFMGFSIASAVLGGTIIICYSSVTNENLKAYRRSEHRDLYYANMATSAIILVLGIAEFVIEIWAAICCCKMNPCKYCAVQQAQQVAYTAISAGYIMAQSPDGVPVAVSMQTEGGMVTMQPLCTQGGQHPIVLVPVAATARDQFVTVQTATGSLPQQADSSSSHGHGQYMPLQEEE